MKFGRPVYFERLDRMDVGAMYRITTQQRLLQNLVVEYEKLEKIRLVRVPSAVLM
jgi:phosphatidylinositol/phosphatidylcholine transfer protein